MDEENLVPYDGILNVGSLPDDYDIKSIVDIMKTQGMMPINSTLQNSATVEDLAKMMVNAEVVNQFALAGDLLATGDLTPKEWFKIKMLIRSENPENNKLAEEILKAKAE